MRGYRIDDGVRWLQKYGPANQSRAVSLSRVHLIYGLWLLAFGLKLVGSSWDVAWHFRYLREDLAIPHVVNTIGMALAMALALYQTVTGEAVERLGLRITQIGIAIFLIAIPLDLLNHRLFGLDLTAYSPTHMMLYLGTAVMLMGIIRSVLHLAPTGRWRTLVGIGMWGFLLEDVLFALGQQEYGTLSIDAFLKGRTTASAELIVKAGANIVAFARGGAPPWVYPLYLILMSTLVLASARRFQGTRWMATAVAGTYLVYRSLAWTVLAAAGFPHSAIPFMILPAAIVIDLAIERRWMPLLTSVAIVGVTYAAERGLAAITVMPPFTLAVAPVAIGVLWLAWHGQPWVERARQYMPRVERLIRV